VSKKKEGKKKGGGICNNILWISHGWMNGEVVFHWDGCKTFNTNAKRNLPIFQLSLKNKT
jgi:hypothetical protein